MKTTHFLEIAIVCTDKSPLTHDGITGSTRQLFKMIKRLERDGGIIKGFFWDQKLGSNTGQFIVKAERTVVA